MMFVRFLFLMTVVLAPLAMFLSTGRWEWLVGEVVLLLSASFGVKLWLGLIWNKVGKALEEDDQEDLRERPNDGTRE